MSIFVEPTSTGSPVHPEGPGVAHGVFAPVPICKVAGSVQTVARLIDGISSIATEAVSTQIERFIFGIRVQISKHAAMSKNKRPGIACSVTQNNSLVSRSLPQSHVLRVRPNRAVFWIRDI